VGRRTSANDQGRNVKQLAFPNKHKFNEFSCWILVSYIYIFVFSPSVQSTSNFCLACIVHQETSSTHLLLSQNKRFDVFVLIFFCKIKKLFDLCVHVFGVICLETFCYYRVELKMLAILLLFFLRVKLFYV
jgi:hypothetical protein